MQLLYVYQTKALCSRACHQGTLWSATPTKAPFRYLGNYALTLVAINFHGVEIFVTAESTTKITNISTSHKKNRYTLCEVITYLLHATLQWLVLDLLVDYLVHCSLR